MDTRRSRVLVLSLFLFYTLHLFLFHPVCRVLVAATVTDKYIPPTQFSLAIGCGCPASHVGVHLTVSLRSYVRLAFIIAVCCLLFPLLLLHDITYILPRKDATRGNVGEALPT
jgi:hypothetical protein